VPYDCNAPLTVVRFGRQWLFSTFQQHGLQVEEFRYPESMFPKQSEIYLAKALTDCTALTEEELITSVQASG
jgi:hypothetical protein